MRMAATTAVLFAATAFGAEAQSDADSDGWSGWSGWYSGVTVGDGDPGNDGGSILFDNTLDGNFGDTVRTVAGADAFSPGFCGGAARSALPAAGCDEDDGGGEYSIRFGYDWQLGRLVLGAGGEYSRFDARDSVSAFSTTPAFYTMTRELDHALSVQGRVGTAFGNDRWLTYLKAGATRARIENSFSTSNAANTFLQSGDSQRDGVQLGAGFERRLVGDFTIGVEYLRTQVDDQDFRVRATRGAAPATNPFVLVNPNGTDFARSDDQFIDSWRVTTNLRF